MALETYSELQASVADWLKRSDLTTQIVDCITLAETEICRWLRVTWNEKRAYAVPDGAFIALPTDYIGMRNVQWNYSDYRVPLEQLSPQQMDQWEMLTETGMPQFYVIQDQQIELRPAPSSDNTTQIEITYYYKPTALSDSNTTNEILDNAPDLLLYAALMITSKITLDTIRVQLFQPEYERIKKELMQFNQKERWGEGNALRIRAV